MSVLNRLPLNAIRAFEAAARHKSFTRAADELNVTHGAISKQVRILEDVVGFPLFERAGKGMRLTPKGRELAEEATRGFIVLERAFEAFLEQAPKRKTVRLTTTPAFAAKFLAPRLGTFQRNHAEITLVIETTARLVDFDAENPDAGIRFGAGKWPGLEAKPLSDGLLMPLCAPDFLARFKTRTPHALLKAGPLLHHLSRREWHEWAELAGLPRLKPAHEYVFEDTNVIFQATLEGQGIALLPKLLAARDIKAGKLVQPFGPEMSGDFRFWFVAKPSRIERAENATLFAWLLEEAKTAEKILLPHETGS